MKIIVVRSEQTGYEDYQETIDVFDSINQLLASLSEDEKSELKRMGWRNVAEIKDKSEKLLLEKEYFLATGSYFRPITLDQLTKYEKGYLTKGSILMQKVNPINILEGKDKEAYFRSQKRIKDEAKAKIAKAKEKKAKAIEKKLEAARKLIQTHAGGK